MPSWENVIFVSVIPGGSDGWSFLRSGEVVVCGVAKDMCPE